MEDQEWLTSTDPNRLLTLAEGRISSRKLRLFGVACCRRIEHILTDPRSRQLVDWAERLADDRTLWDSIDPALHQAREMVFETFGPITGLRSELADLLTNDRGLRVVVFFLLWRTQQSAFEDTRTLIRCTASQYPNGMEDLYQCGLLRCVVGDHSRPRTVNPNYLTWNDHTIVKIAKKIYDDRDFEGLPILADALEEAGCTDDDILNHCRQPGVHVRGCWVVDLMLGKE